MAIEKKRPYHGLSLKITHNLPVRRHQRNHQVTKRHHGLQRIKIQMDPNPQKHKRTLLTLTYSQETSLRIPINNRRQTSKERQEQGREAQEIPLQAGRQERHRLQQHNDLEPRRQPALRQIPPHLIPHRLQVNKNSLAPQETHERRAIEEDAGISQPQEETPQRAQQDRPPIPQQQQTRTLSHLRNDHLLAGYDWRAEEVLGGF